MWPFRPRPTPEPDRDVVERLDTLEDTSKHLERRFIRLQQQFTRFVREWESEYDDVGEEYDDEDEVLQKIRERREAHG